MCFKYEASGLINVFDRFSLLEIMIQLLLILCPGWQKVAAFQRLQKIPQVFCVSNFHDINAVFENLYVSTAGPAPLGPQLLPPCLCLILSQSHLTVHTLWYDYDNMIISKEFPFNLNETLCIHGAFLKAHKWVIIYPIKSRNKIYLVTWP